MKIVKLINTNEVIAINDTEFDANIHIDFSDNIWYWYHHGIELTDYVYAREKIKNIVINNTYANTKYKDEVNIVCGADMTDIITYYVSQGMTQSEATGYYLNRRSVDIQFAGECYGGRLESPEVIATIMMFIGESQGLSLLDAIRNFKEDLKTVALLGTQYGNDRDGVMDYFESTGSYVNSGVLSYAISQDMIDLYGDEATARAEFVNKLHYLIIQKFD